MDIAKEMCILVTGVGGDIGQNVIKCLNESGYHLKLVGCDIDLYAAGRKMVKEFLRAPMALEESNYLKFIQKTIEEDGIRYIYPSTEVEIEFFDRYREYFDKFLTAVFINNPFIVNTFLDKYETVNFLKNNGLSYPATCLIEDYDNQLSFPLLIKARKGSGGRGLIKIKSNEELEFYRKRISNAIVQEDVGTEDDEYTVGVFSDGTDVYSICFRRYLGYGSLSKFVQLVRSDEMKRIVEKIARASHLQGSMNVQFRKTEHGYVPFEINPRISSTAYFRHYFGFQDVKWWLDIKLNKPIDYKLKYQKGIGVRAIGEVFFECSV
jgi:carbamoyl-phosphate synthase large subunit